MRFDTGHVDVPSAGTAVRLLNSSDKVLWIRIKAETGTIYVGRSDVSATNGYPVTTAAGIDVEFDFGQYGGSVLMSDFFVDAASSGDNATWAAIFK
tara:strand:- start:76 stop:363 length:288 start_codon:yes stop_codon:yes gene_type:complete